jgi:hypothetical protein
MLLPGRPRKPSQYTAFRIVAGLRHRNGSGQISWSRPAPSDIVNRDVVSGSTGHRWGFSSVSAIVAFAAACGGQSERSSVSPQDAGELPDASAIDGSALCFPQINRLQLARGLTAPYFVDAPRKARDPVVVQDYEQDQMLYRFIDAQTCKMRATWSPSEGSSAPIALADWIAWLDRHSVWLRNLVSGDEVRGATRATPIAIHADAEWLYVLSAFVEDSWSVGRNEMVQEAFVERIPRSDLARIQNPEPLATLDLSGLTSWNQIRMSGSASQVLFKFVYRQLDVDGPYALLQLRLDTLTQRLLFSDRSSFDAVPAENDVLVQRSNELLLYSGSAYARSLRQDLDHLSVRGVVSGYAIAVDSWFDKKLLALPLDGSAPRELASDVISGDAVSTADILVYWATYAGELWMMVL